MKANFDLAREIAERAETDWVFGAASAPSLVTIPLAEREQYLPMGETQFDQFADFTDCASRSPVNHFEALFTYHYNHGMRPENKIWLEENGYIQDGKVTFSDRFIAILSGTTHNGNSLKSPLEAIRTYGLLPKSLLPKEDWMTWDDYYDKSKITTKMKELASAFCSKDNTNRRFTVNYEQVRKEDIPLVIEYDMLGVAGFAWPTPVNGIYPRALGPFNHAFLVYNLPQYQIFDNYDEGKNDFTKNLAPDYSFYDFGYRAYISQETIVAGPKHLFLKNLKVGQTDPEVKFLQEALILLGYPIPHAITSTFGQETRNALAAFQKAKGIMDDGSNFGPRTRYAMNNEMAGNGSFLDSVTLAMRTFFGAESNMNIFIAILLYIWNAIKNNAPPAEQSTQVPPPPPPKPVPPPGSKIITWALAIQHEEGGKPNDPNTRHHNPGNLKYTSYTASLGGKLGPAGIDGGHFCVFDTYTAGFKALCQFLTDAAEGKLISYKPTMTLNQFTNIYAQPPNDKYVMGVAKALSVDPYVAIKLLL